MVEEKSILKTVLFRDFSKWDVKQFFMKQIKSSYPITFLSELLNEETEKKKLSKFPNEDFGILGISNEEGMFDAYTEKGKNINQPYKIIKNDFIAYNPYRVNVGSIGIKKEHLKNEYISNAYVVFSTKENLLADYLFLLMHTNKFNQLIRDNTTGSVRQTLSFENLGKIAIPVPSIPEQKAIVQKYQDTISKAEAIEKEANFLLNDSHLYFDSLLQIEDIKPSFVSGLNFIHYKNIDLWGIDKNLCRKTIRNKKYKTVPLENLCSVGSGGTPSRNHSEYYRDGNIPWIKTTEVIDEIISDTEEKITQKGLENSSAKLYEANSLIIAMYGQGKTRGRTAKLNVRATTNQACAVLYDINENLVNIDYLWFYFQNEYERIRELASGNNQPNLNAGMIKTYPIVLPPLPVQNEIVEHINQIKAQVKDLRQQAKELREKAKLEFERSVFE